MFLVWALYTSELIFHWFIVGPDYVDHFPNYVYWVAAFLLVDMVCKVMATIILTNLIFLGIMGYFAYIITFES